MSASGIFEEPSTGTRENAALPERTVSDTLRFSGPFRTEAGSVSEETGTPSTSRR